MKKVTFVSLIGFYLSFPFHLQAQKDTERNRNPEINTIAWKNAQQVKSGDGSALNILNFAGAMHPRDFRSSPYLIEKKQVVNGDIAIPELQALETAPLNPEELTIVQSYTIIPTEFISETYTGTARGDHFSFVTILPVRKNKSTGSLEKLISYRLSWKAGAKKISPQATAVNFASSSVLANGTWYKIAIAQTGIYKIDKPFLNKLGINLSNIDPANIRIFGNGARLLPEDNSAFRYDDLNEIAISVSGQSDGVFDNGDYLLFYGKGPDEWDLSANGAGLRFNYLKNFYSDSSYYYLSVDNGPGKRIQQQASATGPYNYSSSTFDDYAIHEVEGSNLVKSGREMYGEYFDINTTYTIAFPFSSLTTGDTAMVKASIAGRTFSGTADFRIAYPAGTYTINCPATGSTYLDDIAREKAGTVKYINNSSNTISLTIDKISSSATGWLNYIEVNVRRDLVMNSAQMSFRDSRNIGPANVSR
ncbi:MAG: hypothetical protein ACJ76F_12070, partial [Bacteroidia bacterium]